MDNSSFHFVVKVGGHEIRRSQGKRWLVVTGYATDGAVDLLRGQMTEDCILQMIETCNEKGQYAPVYQSVKSLARADKKPILIDEEHSDDPNDILGYVSEAKAIYDLTPEMLQRGMVAPVMMVEAWLDMEDKRVQKMAKSLDDGAQLGFSIYGKVPPGGMELVRGNDAKPVERYKRVVLEKIAICAAPANDNMWHTAVREIRRSMGKGTTVNEDEITLEATDTGAAPQSADAPSTTPNTALDADVAQELAAEGLVPATTRPAPALPVIASASPADDVLAPEKHSAAYVAPGSTLQRALGTLAQAAEMLTTPPVTQVTAPVAAVLPQPVLPVAATQPAADPPLPEPDAAAAGSGVVSRSLFEATIRTIMEVLAPLPAWLDEQEVLSTELKRSQAEAESIISKQTEVILSLAERLVELENDDASKRGMRVVRSLLEGADPDVGDAGAGAFMQDESKRVAMMTAFSQVGRGDVAIAIRTGLMPINAIPWHLLPENTAKQLRG